MIELWQILENLVEEAGFHTKLSDSGIFHHLVEILVNRFVPSNGWFRTGYYEFHAWIIIKTHGKFSVVTRNGPYMFDSSDPNFDPAKFIDWFKHLN